MRHLRLDQRLQLKTPSLNSGENPSSNQRDEQNMMKYEIEFIRRLPGRDEPEVIDTHNTLATSLGEVIRRADLSLRTVGFRLRPECFRVRINGGPIIFQSRVPAAAIK
jgi:hypothetical protein